jgi:Domain of unknown function (DUF4124)
MNTRFLVLGWLLVLLAGASYGATREMWMWVDANGVTHYSDRPVPGAKLVSITSMEPVEGPQRVIPPAPPSASKPANRAAPATQYQLLEFFEPENGETFFGTDTVVNVRLRSEPDLATGDRLRVYLDGKLLEDQQPGMEYSLANLDRGAHSLAAQIVDAQGNEKIQAEPLTFNVREPTVVPARNVGPNLRPPRPQPRPGG